jgi:glycine reductase
MEKQFFADKKICILGDRDGIPAPAITACMETVGGEVIFSSTECFV